MKNLNLKHLGNHLRLHCAVAASVVCLLALPAAAFATKPRPAPAAVGAIYQSVPAVTSEQAQVILLRKALAGDAKPKGAAHVYVNREFHTGLMPWRYTRFCLPPGSHSLEGYIGDAPTYAGKEKPKTRVMLEGGKTYFAAVSESGLGTVTPMKRAEAEQALAGAREQQHVLSRASTVVACETLPEDQKVVKEPRKPKNYVLSSDVLFSFGQGDYQAITPKGRAELRRLVAQINEEELPGDLRITVRGHADPIGSASANLKLSEQRAATVRRVIAEEGLSASRVDVEAVGSAEPVVSCSINNSRSTRICNAPNRRVEVVVEGNK